jgi:hypothetical protein
MKNIKKISFVVFIIIVITSLTFYFNVLDVKEEIAYDYLKELITEYRVGRKALNDKENTNSDDFKAYTSNYYTKYEGKKIKLKDLALLGIAKIDDGNTGVYKAEKDGKKQPKYRLFLAPYKKVDNGIVAFGSLEYVERNNALSTYGDSKSSVYSIEAKTFSPIDMVDDDMKGVSIIADVYDDLLIKNIEAIQTIFGVNSLYDKYTIDSLIVAKKRDFFSSTPEGLGLNFLLNSLDLTVQFPEYIEDFDFNPISSDRLAFDVIEINNINKFKSDGRTLFESFYKIDYANWFKNYITVKPEYYGSILQFGAEVKTFEKTFDNDFKGAHETYNDFYPKLGLIQIKPFLINDTASENIFNGSILKGMPFDGIFKGKIEASSDSSIFIITNSIYCSESSKKQISLVKKTFDVLKSKNSWGEFINFVQKSGEFKFSKGKLCYMQYGTTPENIIKFTLNEKEEIIEIKASWAKDICIFNPSSKNIEILSEGTTILISTINGVIKSSAISDTLSIR